MKTNHTLKLSLELFMVLGVAGSCIIPDRDIVVIVVDPCGEEWAVQTVGAVGYNGIGKAIEIKTNSKEWISKSFCLSPEQGEQMADPASALAAQALFDITLICQERALEMGILDADDTCLTTAAIAYLGKCSNPPAGCVEPDTETGDTETDADSDPSGAITDFSSLVPSAEVILIGGEHVVSQHLIDVALADPVGVSNDGTTVTQVFAHNGQPYGFEVDGITTDNLGSALGLHNGDIITAVEDQPTATYDDLLQAAGVLLAAERATLDIERGTSSISLRYRRSPI